eukprot:2484716-Prymnesium_polylepis.1
MARMPNDRLDALLDAMVRAASDLPEPRSNKHLAIQVRYDGRVRTQWESCERDSIEIWDIL